MTYSDSLTNSTSLRENGRIEDSSENAIRRIDIAPIQRLLQSGSPDECQRVISMFLSEIGSDSLNSVMLRYYVVMEIYLACGEFSRKSGITKDEFLARFGDADSIMMKINGIKPMTDFLNELLLQCVEWRVRYHSDSHSSSVERAKEYISLNYSNDTLSLGTVAAHVSLSATYFSSLFRREAGMTFVEYLNQIRIEHAKELLCCTLMQVSEIAYATGYTDYRYFSQVFKRYTGHTPRDFQKANSKLD